VQSEQIISKTMKQLKLSKFSHMKQPWLCHIMFTSYLSASWLSNIVIHWFWCHNISHLCKDLPDCKVLSGTPSPPKMKRGNSYKHTTQQAHWKGGGIGESFPRPCNVWGAPPSLQNNWKGCSKWLLSDLK